jgi:phage tail-like protein
MASTLKTVSQSQSLAARQTDPLRSFKFHVQISQVGKLSQAYPKLGFMSVSGLSVTTDVIAYRAGGMNTTTQKMPGQSDFSPVTLSKGMMPGDQNLVNWMYQLFDVMQGNGSGSDTGSEFRATIDIMLIDHPVTKSKAAVKAVWRLYNAWPTSVAFGDLDAGSNTFAVSQLTFAHEGWDFKVADSYGPNSYAVIK